MSLFAGLDFETYSDVDLKEYGLYNYANHESFTVLMADIDTEKHGTRHYDFILNNPEDLMKFKVDLLDLLSAEYKIVAHNAGFERMVLNHMSIHIDNDIVDSAVYARMMGAGEKLEMASRQMTSHPKMAVGADLIQLFCVPNSLNGGVPDKAFVQRYENEWIIFGEYCGVDAQGSRELAEVAERLFIELDAPDLMEVENERELVTYAMNKAGWHFDRILIQKMIDRAWANTLIEKQQFFLDSGENLNFDSPKQLKDYCAARGVEIISLDKYQLPVVLTRVQRELEELELSWPSEEETRPLREVIAMLECKQELGGSSLSKLQKTLDLGGEDDILRDQYIHVGAGQTFRTSGRGVQMQNLKKLGGNIRDMATVYDYDEEWTNTDLSTQLRQVFTAREDDGLLFVGDFSAVESRGLAYLAGEEWKLDAYRKGMDVYKVLVTKYLNIAYDEVTAEQRPRGKYTELSCGYQASAIALQDFMFRLGFKITLDDAAKDVADWRRANPAVTQFWKALDESIKGAVSTGKPTQFKLPYGQQIRVKPFWVKTIQDIHPGATSLSFQIVQDGKPIVTRIIHGCYFKGNALCYYKPVEYYGKGELWTPRNKTQTQKQKREVLLTVYGGKMAGIATQSLCRELFFDAMVEAYRYFERVENAEMVGQFHDEINVDWWPGLVSKAKVEERLKEIMSHSRLPQFPMAVEVKSAYRYIK